MPFMPFVSFVSLCSLSVVDPCPPSWESFLAGLDNHTFATRNPSSAVLSSSGRRPESCRDARVAGRGRRSTKPPTGVVRLLVDVEPELLVHVGDRARPSMSAIRPAARRSVRTRRPLHPDVADDPLISDLDVNQPAVPAYSSMTNRFATWRRRIRQQIVGAEVSGP